MGLGKSFKKVKNTVKKGVSSPLGKVLAPGLGFAEKLAGGAGNFLGGKPGPGNPFGAPDMGFLQDTSRLDYLKDPNQFKFLMDSSPYDFLRNNPMLQNLPGQGKTFADAYKGAGAQSEALFKDLIGNINAPSSVDSVRGEIEGDLMKSLLQGVDTDTRQAVGSLKSDFADRGLSGPGMGSDIEAAGLGQTYSSGAKRKGDIRSEFAGRELDRLKAREESARGAYGQRYTTGTEIGARGAMSDAQMFNELLGMGANLQAGQDRSYADLISRGRSDYGNALQGNNQLFAQLLNARDLGMFGQQADLFNAGADRQLSGRRPGVIDYFGKAFGNKLGDTFGSPGFLSGLFG